MISFEVLNSTDIDQIGAFEFQKNSVIFSSISKADFLVDLAYSFALEIKDNELFLLNPNSDESVLINNKFSGSINKLKKDDSICAGDYEVSIKDFYPSNKLSYKEELNLNTQKIIESQPEILKMITKLREEMKDAK